MKRNFILFFLIITIAFYGYTEDPESLLIQGIECFRIKLYKKSIELLSKYIEQNKNNEKAFFFRALSYMETDLFYMAINDLNEAIEIMPKFKEAFYEKVRWYGMSNQYELALQDCQFLLLLENETFKVYDLMGYLYLRSDKGFTALEFFDKAITLNKYFFPAYVHRAEAYKILGNYNSSLRDLNLALEINNRYHDIYFVLALILLEQNDIKKALEYLEKTIYYNKAFLPAYLIKSKIYKIINNKKESDLSLYYILENAKGNFNDLNIKGMAYLELENYEDAIKFFLLSSESNPLNLDAYININEAYIKTDRYKEALDILEKAEKRSFDKFSRLSIAKANVYYLMGDYEMAINYYQNVFGTLSSFIDPYIYYYFLSYKISKEKFEASLNLLKEKLALVNEREFEKHTINLLLGTINDSKYLQLKNKYKIKLPYIYYTLGEYFLINKNRTRAKEYFLKCIDLNDKSAVVTFFSMHEIKMLEN